MGPLALVASGTAITAAASFAGGYTYENAAKGDDWVPAASVFAVPAGVVVSAKGIADEMMSATRQGAKISRPLVVGGSMGLYVATLGGVLLGGWLGASQR